MFLKQLQVGHMAVFAYIIGDIESGEGIVVDPGADIDGILSEARNNRVKSSILLIPMVTSITLPATPN